MSSYSLHVRNSVVLASAALATGCATVHIQPTFEMSSAYMIEQTLDEIDLVALVGPAIPNGSTVTLLPMGGEGRFESQELAALEDQLVQDLLDADLRVLARDPAISSSMVEFALENRRIQRLLAGDAEVTVEQRADTRLLFDTNGDGKADTSYTPRADRGANSTFLKMMESSGATLVTPGRKPSLVLEIDPEVTPLSTPTETEEEPIEAVPTAPLPTFMDDTQAPPLLTLGARTERGVPDRMWDRIRQLAPDTQYFVAYRIQEYGVNFREVPDNLKLRQRDARVRVHVQVIDVAQREIVAARTLDATNTDTVRRELQAQLQNYHYGGAYYDYPQLAGRPHKPSLNIRTLYLTPAVFRFGVNLHSTQGVLGEASVQTRSGRFGIEALTGKTTAFGVQYSYPFELYPRVSLVPSAGVKVGEFQLSVPIVRAGPRLGLEVEVHPLVVLHASFDSGISLLHGNFRGPSFDDASYFGAMTGATIQFGGLE